MLITCVLDIRPEGHRSPGTILNIPPLVQPLASLEKYCQMKQIQSPFHELWLTLFLAF